MKVGFIGLGHMGEPMSRNILAAGHDLVVHDVRGPAEADLEFLAARRGNRDDEPVAGGASPPATDPTRSGDG